MRYLTGFLLCMTTLAGCRQHSGEGGDGRVVAAVNGVEISSREVDYFYRQSALPGESEDAVRDRKRQVLSDLVRLELLARNGSEMKLDHSSDFILAMYEARRNVLGWLVEQRLAEQQRVFSPDEVRKFVAENPDFFSRRKILVYDQIVLNGVNEQFLQSLNDRADEGASLDQLLDRVTQKKMPFRRTLQALATDQIDSGILSLLLTSSLNRPRVARIEEKFSIILMLRGSVPVPRYGQEALQAGAAILGERQRKAALSACINNTLDSAHITYFGEFAPGKNGKDVSGSKVELPAGKLPLQP